MPTGKQQRAVPMFVEWQRQHDFKTTRYICVHAARLLIAFSRLHAIPAAAVAQLPRMFLRKPKPQFATILLCPARISICNRGQLQADV